MIQDFLQVLLFEVNEKFSTSCKLIYIFLNKLFAQLRYVIHFFSFFLI